MARVPSGGGLTPAATSGKQAWLAYAALGVAAAGIIAVMVYKYMANPEPPAITVSAMVPSPTTVYRFWDATAKVDRVEAPAFSFSGDGKVAEIAAPGTRYGAGDVLALLEGGKKFRADLAHNRERLGYYEQMRDSMAQQNNKPEVRQAELKIAEKKRLIAEAQAALTKQAIIATTPGEIGETLAQVGATVKAGDPAMKAKGTGYRATFELPPRGRREGAPAGLLPGGDRRQAARLQPGRRGRRRDPPGHRPARRPGGGRRQDRPPGPRSPGRRVLRPGQRPAEDGRQRPPVRGHALQPRRAARGRRAGAHRPARRSSPRAWTWATGSSSTPRRISKPDARVLIRETVAK